MVDNFYIVIAQINPIVGDFASNQKMIIEVFDNQLKAPSHEQGDIIIFPELVLCGYPIEDLVFRADFQNDCYNALSKIAEYAKSAFEKLGKVPAMLIGLPFFDGKKLYNSLFLIDEGEIKFRYDKKHLPNYGVFDEYRIFDKGEHNDIYDLKGVKLGFAICEDIWFEGVCNELKNNGAEIIISPHGSPFCDDKYAERLEVAKGRVLETALPLVFCNLIGGQDELVFDGGSFVLNPDAKLALQMKDWCEDIAIARFQRNAVDGTFICEEGAIEKIFSGDEALYQACVLGLRDYVNKNGFKSVVFGLSGGVDSALCAAISVDALSASRVKSMMLPYKYTSDESLDDAKECAKNLDIEYNIIPIEKAVNGFFEILKEHMGDPKEGVTYENIQSRVRGSILMASSNAEGSMVVATGNKSEMGVGYATLYGDMNGGFNPIKDLYKTKVFDLARFRNQKKPYGCLGPDGVVIAENIITKPPTAELRENQTDQDSLPEYDVLDEILYGFTELDKSAKEIINSGFDKEIVYKVERLLFLAEYKRRQSAPGVKLSKRNFGKDRRYPITNHYLGHKYIKND